MPSLIFRNCILCLTFLLLASCAKGTDPKLLQQVSTYHETIHKEYVGTYLTVAVALNTGQYDGAANAINEFMSIQERASLFWKGIAVPSEAEPYKAQMLDSFTGAKAIDARYEQYTQSYKSFLQTVFPNGGIAIR